MWLIYLIGIVGIGLFLAMFISCVIGIPPMPTHLAEARLMMEMAKVTRGTRVVDLGSGTGRLLFFAAKRGATAVGYELNPLLYLFTLLRIWLGGWRGQVSVKCTSFFNADVRDADVVCMFLFPNIMARVADKLQREARPGTTLVSYAFSLPGFTLLQNNRGIKVYQR